jgi:hypothetical protein
MYNIFKALYVTLFRVYRRQDLTQWDRKADAGKPVYGMYHVYCAEGWQKLVKAQIHHLKASGLLDATKTLFVSCIVMNDTDETDLRRLIDSDKMEIVSITRKNKLYEYPALEYVRRKCLDEDCYFYYFHTKGVTYYIDEPHNRHFMKFKRNVEAWRGLMEYFLMDKWNVAVRVLNDGYDTYGCYRYPPAPAPYVMYGGNFWWAKSSYLRTLQPLFPEKMADDRMFAELWIYTGNNKAFSAFDTIVMLYRVFLPESLYKLVGPPLSDRIRFMLRFNFTKIAKKVFKYNYAKHNNDKFQKI